MGDRRKLTSECTVCGFVKLNVGRQKTYTVSRVYKFRFIPLRSLLFWKCTVDMLK